MAADPASAGDFEELAKQLEDTSQCLADARHEIALLDTSRRQFFAWISHDLRTPLTAVNALTEALEDSGGRNQSSYLCQVRAQVSTMNRLVDDLFDLSQILSGSLRLKLVDIELLEVVSDAVADVRLLADLRNIRIIQAGVEGHLLRADPHELTQVIVNLLTNSIRHAPSSSEILISAGQHNDRLILSVLDQGSGVDSADLSRIFEAGWRASTARTSAAGDAGGSGAGLGLAIVQGIVTAYGGSVAAERVAWGFRLNVALPALAPT